SPQARRRGELPSGLRDLELHTGGLFNEKRKAGTQFAVGGILVISAEGVGVLEVGDDGEVPVALAQAGVTAHRVAHGPRAVQRTETVLEAPHLGGVIARLELGQN